MAEFLALEEFGAVEEETTAAAELQYPEGEGEAGTSQLEEDESLFDSSAPVAAIDTSQLESDDSVFNKSEPAEPGALDTTDDSIDVNSGKQSTRAFLEESSQLGRASQDMSASMAQISRKHVDDIAAIEMSQIQTPVVSKNRPRDQLFRHIPVFCRHQQQQFHKR